MARFLTIVIIFFYTLIFIMLGAGLIAVAWGLIQPQDLNAALSNVQTSLNYKLVFTLSGILLVLISISFAQLVLERFQRERTIAFSTSSGQVTISLSAVEDLIKRLTNIIPEIKELRPDVIATKKGLIVDLRVVLKSEANIPELTSRLQEITRSKIQEVLGIEEQIIIKIHVAKIINPEEKERKRREPEKEDSAIPFSGYGRV